VLINRTTSWKEEAEVVVVGYGGAGAVTAIAAHDAGAKGLILEKQSSDTPTQTWEAFLKGTPRLAKRGSRER